MQKSSISVIIVSWNTKDLLQTCLTSLFKELATLGINYEVILIDNNSNDGSVKMVRGQFPEVKLIANSDNRGFGQANNQGFEAATGELILLLNPDTVVLPNSIAPLIEFLETHPRAGLVAPQMLNTDRSVQSSCQRFPTLSGMFFDYVGLSKLFPSSKFGQFKMLDFDHTETRQVDQPEGACMLIPRKVLDQVGWFDKNFFMYFEDVDLCYRLKKAGWEIWFFAGSQIIHHLGQSTKKNKPTMIRSAHKGLYYFWAKHHPQWYHRLVTPFVRSGLEILAILRVKAYELLHRAPEIISGQGLPKILDAGCGLGIFVKKESTIIPGEYYGIDFDSSNISAALANHPSIKFQVMSVEYLDFPNDYFDMIYSRDVLEHVDNPDLALKEMTRVLKPGGVLKIQIPAANSERWLLKIRPSYHEEIHHVRIFEDEAIEKLVAPFNLKLIEKQRVNFTDHFYLYFLFHSTKIAECQTGMGSWRNHWWGIFVAPIHGYLTPEIVFGTWLKYIPIWLVTLPLGYVINYFGNKVMPKSLTYEYQKLR